MTEQGISVESTYLVFARRIPNLHEDIMNVHELRLHDLGFKTVDELLTRYEQLITGLIEIDNTIILASGTLKEQAVEKNWPQIAVTGTGALLSTHKAIVSLLNRDPA